MSVSAKQVCSRLAIVATLSAAAMTGLPSGAEARDGVNAAIIGGGAAGLIGGLAVGTMMSRPPPPAYVVPAEPVYVERRRVYEPTCHYERRKVWLDDESFTYRRVEVCE